MSFTATPDPTPQHAGSEQRTLATNAILALLIAVAGLLAAGSLPLVTNADTGTAGASRTQPVSDPVDDGGRSATLQSALLAEVAAQRGDALAKNAELVARTSLSAADSARQQRLTAAEAAVQAAAVQVAKQRLAAAMAARQAAYEARVLAEARARADQTTAGQTTADPTLSGQVTTPVTGTAGRPPSGTKGVLPISAGIVGAGFKEYGHWSRYHTGLDFRAAYGTQIHVVLSGVVVYAGNSGDWAGNHVAVRHSDGRTTMYSHMSRMAVSAGQNVRAGQVIGYVGETGRAFGAHLHFELYPRGVRYGDVYSAINPIPWLRSIGVRTH